MKNRTGQNSTAVQPKLPTRRKVVQALKTHGGDEVVIEQVAHRITRGMRNDKSSVAATNSFLGLIETLCANGKIVAVE